MTNTQFEKLLRSREFKRQSPQRRLMQMLARRPLKDLIEEGLVLTTYQVTLQTGYTRQHIRRLVIAGALPALARGLGGESGRIMYLFLPEQVATLFNTYEPIKS